MYLILILFKNVLSLPLPATASANVHSPVVFSIILSEEWNGIILYIINISTALPSIQKI